MAPPRLDPLARSRLVERLNGWLETAWAKGLCSRPTLGPEALWRAAAGQGEAGGRGEADVADFRERLERLCSALREEAGLNPLGVTMAYGQLVRVIRQRVALGRMWTRRPQLLHTELAPPILVVGQMRGGTTRVHRLLAADPAHSATRFCDSWYPVPERPDLRPLWSAMTLAFAHRLNPWLDTIHPFGTTRADEELGWLACALDPCAYEVQWRIPSFVRWSEAADPAPVYREFARILATDAAVRGNAHRPRVMKVPQFAQDLAALLARFPDAGVVIARREAGEVVGSSSSMVANQMTVQSDTVDLTWIGGEWRRKVALREERLAGGLAGFSGPLAELDYRAIEEDWRAAMRGCYSALGLAFTHEAEAAMAREMARGPRPAPAHRYELERFGLSPAQLA